MASGSEWKEVEIVGPSTREAHKEVFRFRALVPHDFKDLKERGGPHWAVCITPPSRESVTVLDNEGEVHFFSKVLKVVAEMLYGAELYRLDAQVERVPNGMGHPYPGIAMSLRGTAERGQPKLTTKFRPDNGGIGVEVEITR